MKLISMPRRAVFINKYLHSQHPGRSTHEERRIINEQNRARRTRAPPRVGDEDVEREESQEKLSRSNEQLSRTRASSQRLSRLIQYEHSGRTSEQDESLLRSGSQLPLGLATSDLSNPSSNAIDPFSATSVTINAEIAELLRYYSDVLYESIWKNAAASIEFEIDHKELGICTPEKVISECVVNEARMYTLLANCACHMQHLDGMLLPTDCLRYVQKGITLYSKEFEAREWVVDQQMLLHSVHLCTAAFASQQIDTIRIHLNGLRALVSRVDATTANLTIPAVALVATVDVTAPDKLSPLLNEEQRLIWLEQSGLISKPAHSITHSAMDVENPFLLARVDSIITPAMVRLIASCHVFVRAFESAINLDPANDILATMKQLSFHNRTLRQEIILVKVDDIRSKCLVHTLLLWTWMADHIGKKLAEAAASHIKDQIEHISEDLWIDSQDLLLWMCITATSAARDGSHVQRRLLDRAIDLAEKLNVVQSDRIAEDGERKLSDFMKQYLWIDSIQQPRLVALLAHVS